MRRALILAITVCALAACGSSAAAPGGSPSRGARGGRAACGPGSAKTLAAGRQARVYVSGDSVFGCAAGGAHQYRLGSAQMSCIGSDRVGPVAVAGRVAGFGVLRCGIDTGSGMVQVRNLASGALLYSHVAATVTRPESYSSVGSIVVTGAGTVAWIGRASSIISHDSASVVVYLRDGTGVRQLDSGPAIVVSSLRRRGSTVVWRHGQAQRSARL